MIKAIIFDFDGVLVESAGIKTEAFRDIFSRWPQKAQQALEHHKQNMGISRYHKFENFYQNIICQPYSQEIAQSLAGEFSRLVVDKVKAAPFVRGAREFLETDHQKYLLFIASGTPQNEMDLIVSAKGIKPYFREVFGSPASKIEITRRILNKYLLDKSEVVFIGDARSDKLAAKETGTHFILRRSPENNSLVDSDTEAVDDLSCLKEALDARS